MPAEEIGQIPVQATLVGGLRLIEAGDEAVAPGDEVLRMARRAGTQGVQFGRRRQQRVGKACVAVELLVEQALAHAAGGDGELARTSDPDDLFQHHGPVSEEGTARFGDALHILQQGRVARGGLAVDVGLGDEAAAEQLL